MWSEWQQSIVQLDKQRRPTVLPVVWDYHQKMSEKVEVESIDFVQKVVTYLSLSCHDGRIL